MEKQGRFLERLTMAADLPDEAIPGLPLVEISGCGRVLVENHFGVTEYGRDRIRVRVKFGDVCVCGSCLELSRMTKGQLIIRGKIESISLNRR
jgi:sporulation protein YqfC